MYAQNEESPGSAGPEEDQVWVLQRPDEAPTLNTTGQDEHRNAWRAEGAAEILHSLGYQERRNGLELKYRQRCSPEASVVARLTLDMLVLAEEFRLFLTGTHQYPTNVSSLFFPESLNTGAISDLPLRPPSSEGSFVSAQSEAVIAARPQSEASSVTDDDTETLQTCTIQTAQSKLTRNKSTSEEDVTLREEDNKIVAVEKDTASAKKEEHKTEVAVEKDTASAEKEEHETETTAQPSTEANTKASPERQVPPTPIIPDEAAAPDTQAKLATTRTSEASPGNETVTPTTTPAEPSAVDSSCKTDKDSLVSTPAATNDTTNDNPEEHVYEEIDVIRAQVQSLRASSVPAESVPPPLPPKKKINAGGEDESQLSFTYPHVDRSSASTPASLRGGSTGARRKKRRAPMPPEFLPPNWKESQETPKQQDLEVKDKKQESAEPSTTKKAEYRRSLNPFYEELECVENSVKEADDNKDADQEDALDSSEDKGNPFLEKKVKVKGYIGKNPFYEDVEILKKSDEYKELEASQPSPAALESTPAPVITSEHHEPPLRKRRAPHPPPSTQAQDTSATSHPEDSAHPQHGIDNLEAANAPQATERSDGSDQPCKQISQSSPDESNIDSSLLASSDSTKTDPENKTDPEPETKDPINKDAKIVAAENKSTPPPLPEDGPQERQMEAAVPTTPKQSRVTRTPLPHPKVPPPPLPPLPKIPTSSLSTEESPPPIPPPKAPLSLFDEIPYMDANEIKEAQEQTQSSDSHLQSIAGGGSPAAVVKFSHTLSRQSPLARADDVNLPPLGLPPPPPCPPPESPPETPHTSPPETPHTSPPETPHVSPPETPHTSPPETPHASPPVCTAGLGPTSSARKGEIAAIFGPPKPPRRRRHNHSPPPRPPKSCSLDGTKTDGLNEVSLGSTSTTSSYTSSSSGHPPPSLQHKSNTKHRSWPFLLCNCLYVNCRTYEDADK
ncbi:hypothetical protein E2C01_007967 [Portunus trituberculatus]|uniref:Uncharacterized protein n=1 Tax=Portunus trituberculatus TaxID=210409 RepID=A0A5B7D511_PORTR|nr:hypothetical protein [Portunus trituberculatus]